MGVRYTQDAENARVAESVKNREQASSYEYLKTTSLVEAVHFARDNGWKEKKVQVRVEIIDSIETLFVEPFERDCGCKGLLRYADFYD